MRTVVRGLWSVAAGRHAVDDGPWSMVRGLSSICPRSALPTGRITGRCGHNANKSLSCYQYSVYQ